MTAHWLVPSIVQEVLRTHCSGHLRCSSVACQDQYAPASVLLSLFPPAWKKSSSQNATSSEKYHQRWYCPAGTRGHKCPAPASRFGSLSLSLFLELSLAPPACPAFADQHLALLFGAFQGLRQHRHNTRSCFAGSCVAQLRTLSWRRTCSSGSRC